MRYFDVKKETLVGTLVSGTVFSDGEYADLPDDIEQREITTGFSVFEYDEQGMTERVNFYPVKIDLEAWTTNEDEVLGKIKEDYQPLEWQNNNW